MFRFGTTQSWDGYGTTRNTSLDFKVNLNGSGVSNTFASSGTITITVGATNFTALSSGTVQITRISGSIKKYKEPDKPPTTDNLEDISGGINEPVTHGTKLYIEATGNISKPIGITDSEVTIKATLTVSSNGNLGTGLELAGNTSTDPSSKGLSGSITPQGTGGKVTIKDSNITLKEKALAALRSLTKNAVTLSSSGGSGFKSSASITVTSKDVDFRTLHDSNKLEITSISGSIKNSDGKSELTTGSTPLSVGIQLSLNATGTLSANTASGAVTATVNLTGIIVVSTGGSLGTSGLTFGGGPNRTGVTGTLALEDQTGTTNYIKITSSGSGSKIEIDKAAYDTIKDASDTTSSSFTIGSADPRDPTKADADGLNKEECFTNYWHLLPSDRYDSDDIPYPEVIFPAMMIVLVATFFPPIIVATLQLVDATKPYSPKTKFAGATVGMGGWRDYGTANTTFYHAFDILIVLKISLPIIFIYSVQYTLNRSGTDAAPMCEITKDASNTKLTIKYTTADGTEKVKDATTDPSEGTNTVTDAKNIRYTFTLTEQLSDGDTTETTTVTIEYGHIHAEGFGGWTLYASTHKADPGRSGDCASDESKDVHAWIWHFFDILLVFKILLTAILLILK